jgi:hypothetical protein
MTQNGVSVLKLDDGKYFVLCSFCDFISEFTSDQQEAKELCGQHALKHVGECFA